MERDMTQRAVLFIGPPGAGKDTQAALLVQEYGMVQVPSSKIIRDKFAANPDDPAIQRERAIFDRGDLNTPELVAVWIMEFVDPLAQQGKSLVFSGSPRTHHEAVVELPLLEEAFGPERIVTIALALDLDEARRRILARRFCEAKGHVIPGTPEFSYLTTCPEDGSPLVTRALDKADKIDIRFQQYHDLTEPVFEVIRKRGLQINEVDGSLPIQAVHQAVVGVLERNRLPVPRD